MSQSTLPEYEQISGAGVLIGRLESLKNEASDHLQKAVFFGLATPVLAGLAFEVAKSYWSFLTLAKEHPWDEGLVFAAAATAMGVLTVGSGIKTIDEVSEFFSGQSSATGIEHALATKLLEVSSEEK